MASIVISFRLSDIEIQALKALSTSSDQSLNQTAARLLRSILGTSTVTSTAYTELEIREIVRQEVEAIAPSTLVDNVDIREMIRQEVSAALSSIKPEVAKSLEPESSSPEQGESIEQELKPDYEAIRDQYLASLKLGRQSPEYKRAAKHLDGFLKMLLGTSNELPILSRGKNSTA